MKNTKIKTTMIIKYHLYNISQDLTIIITVLENVHIQQCYPTVVHITFCIRLLYGGC